VNDEELEVGEVRGKDHASGRQHTEHHVPLAFDQRCGSEGDERDNQHREISRHAVQRDWKSQKHGPLAGLHRLAPARRATLDRPAEAERVQPEVERNEQADEREDRDRLAMTHQ